MGQFIDSYHKTKLISLQCNISLNNIQDGQSIALASKSLTPTNQWYAIIEQEFPGHNIWL